MVKRTRRANRIKVGTGTNSLTRREKIMEVAQELIAKHGPEDFQLQDVAKALNVKPPALYNHFRSRDDLVAAVALKGSREVTALQQRHPGEDPLEAYVRLARTLMGYVIENRWFARLILWEITKGGVPNWIEATVVDAEFRDRQRRAFARARRAGQIRNIRIEAFMPYLLAGVAASSLWSEYDSEAKAANEKQLKREVEDLVRRMLSPDPSPAD